MAAREIDFEMSIAISATPQKVWTHIVDWEHLHLWMKEGKDFRVTSAQRDGVGVTATAVISMGGITTKDAIRVSKWEPPTLFEITHLGWVKGTGTMRCLPTDTGTAFHWRESLQPPLGLAGFIGMWLLRPLIKRTFVSDLGLLKELVEKTGAG